MHTRDVYQESTCYSLFTYVHVIHVCVFFFFFFKLPAHIQFWNRLLLYTQLGMVLYYCHDCVFHSHTRLRESVMLDGFMELKSLCNKQRAKSNCLATTEV